MLTSADFHPPLTFNVDGRELVCGMPLAPRPYDFIMACEKEQLYGGAKRGSKTFTGCQKLMMLATAFPGNQLGMFRKTLKDLRESTLITWDKLFPENHPLILKHHKTHFYYLIRTNGQPSVLHYGGLGEQVDFESAKGKEYGAFFIDEPSEIEEDAYLQMLAQLCWVLPDGSRPPYMAMMGSNPEPGWVEERFRSLIDKTSDDVGHASNGSQIFVRALPKDNPYLPNNWERDLRVSIRNKAWVDKYLGGSWDVSEGQVFKDFDSATHVIDCPPESYLRTLALYASLDHATTGTVCVGVVGIDPDGNLISLGSYYEKNRLISEHSRGIRQLLDEWAVRCGKQQLILNAPKDPGIHPSVAAYEYILIDPSTQAKTNQSATGLMATQDLYRREGIPTIPAWNAIEPGLELMQEYLHPSPTHVHPIKSHLNRTVFGSPRWLIVGKYNVDGIKEIVRFKKTISERGAIKYVGADHWLDNQRYIMMSRPNPPERTSTDIAAMDSITRKVVESHSKWSQNFGVQPDSNQWFTKKEWTQ